LPDADLELLLTTVKQAGDIALRFHGKSPKNWSKPDNTHVTEADIAVDTFLKDTVMNVRPDDGWLSEETPDTSDRLSRRRLWIADPIDGTRLFLAGEHGWGVGMALTIDGKPVMSAIYCPSQKKLFHAVVGQGAFCNEVPLRVEGTDQRDVIAPKVLTPLLAEKGLQWRSGSSLPLLLRFCAAAEGTLAGTYTPGDKNDWDIAAGHLILVEAGGIVSNSFGKPISYNNEKPFQAGVVAAAATWHKAILDCVGMT
jgi:myo-inositol-1(or 4)-monophosphatase